MAAVNEVGAEVVMVVAVKGAAAREATARGAGPVPCPVGTAAGVA